MNPYPESIDAREKQIQELIEQNIMLARNHLLFEQDFIECLDLLFEMTYQQCAVHPYGVEDCLDSMALRTNVEAMEYLAKHGRLEITKRTGRRVFATVVVQKEKEVNKDV
jgi:hypothetical protein